MRNPPMTQLALHVETQNLHQDSTTQAACGAVPSQCDTTTMLFPTSPEISGMIDNYQIEPLHVEIFPSTTSPRSFVHLFSTLRCFGGEAVWHFV